MALTISESIILKDFGEQITEQLKFDIKNKKITKFGEVDASGALFNSIRFELYDEGLKIFGLDYIFFLEKGRASGKFPPIDAIKQWIKDKRIEPKDEKTTLNQLAFLFARKIAQKGTTIFEQGGSDLITDVISNKLISDISAQMTAVFINEISSDISEVFSQGQRITARAV